MGEILPNPPVGVRRFPCGSRVTPRPGRAGRVPFGRARAWGGSAAVVDAALYGDRPRTRAGRPRLSARAAPRCSGRVDRLTAQPCWVSVSGILTWTMRAVASAVTSPWARIRPETKTLRPSTRSTSAVTSNGVNSGVGWR